LCLLSLQGIWSARQKRPRAGVRIPSRAWYAREPIPPMADRLMGDTPRWSAPGPLCATTAPCGRAGPGGRRPAAAGAFCESLREGGGPATGDDKGGRGGWSLWASKEGPGRSSITVASSPDPSAGRRRRETVDGGPAGHSLTAHDTASVVVGRHPGQRSLECRISPRVCVCTGGWMGASKRAHRDSLKANTTRICIQ